MDMEPILHRTGRRTHAGARTSRHREAVLRGEYRESIGSARRLHGRQRRIALYLIRIEGDLLWES